MSIQELGPREAHDALQQQPDAVFVDVRTTAEYAAGHPAGAVNVPFMNKGLMGMSPNPEFLSVITAVAPKDKRIVLSCQSGQRSMRAAELMAQNGWTDLVNVRAGWGGTRDGQPGWAACGLPAETGEPAGKSYEDQKKKVK